METGSSLVWSMAARSAANEGDCGACTIVLLEPESAPRPINGCLSLVGSLVGRSILTSGGLVASDVRPIRRSRR